MNPVSTHLEISAASIRLAGYVIESQLRVAQELGKVALTSNFFATPAEMRKPASKPKQTELKETLKPKKTATKSVKAVKSATPISAKAAKPTDAQLEKAVTAKRGKKPSVRAVAPAPVEVAEKPVAPKVQAISKIKPKLPITNNATEKPQKPAAKMPEFKSRATKTTAPVKTKASATAKKTSPQVTVKVAKTDEAASTLSEPQQKTDKAHRAPSTPPAMPGAGKGVPKS
ncbi:hypothetical protein [uncultured Roseovarius sp.]|uniref:hypothetical protein n=1 Tax=uncultured Roseovarius sp. TaxID=293344 RepID=UPI00261522D9|nr:hypothetical protein [uncultured Roseovarius sp.]